MLARAVVAGHLAAARGGSLAVAYCAVMMSRGAHPERQAGRDRAVERRDPVVALLERPGDPDLGALVALAADHERDPAGPVEDPHPLVDGPREGDEAVHLDEVGVGQARRSRRGASRPLGHGHRAVRPPLRRVGRPACQKLIDRPSTAMAASPRTSDERRMRVGRPPISRASPRARMPSDALAMRSVACGPMMWTPRVSLGLDIGDYLREALVLAADDRLGDRLNGTLPTLYSVPRGVHLLPRSARSTRSPAGSRSSAAGREYKVGKVPFQAIAKALIGGEYEGFAKVIADTTTGDTIGVHIVGPHATDLIAEACARLLARGHALGDRRGNARASDAVRGHWRGRPGGRRAVDQLLGGIRPQRRAPDRAMA